MYMRNKYQQDGVGLGPLHELVGLEFNCNWALQTLNTEETFIPQLLEGGGGECLSYFYYQLS